MVDLFFSDNVDVRCDWIMLNVEGVDGPGAGREANRQSHFKVIKGIQEKDSKPGKTYD